MILVEGILAVIGFVVLAAICIGVAGAFAAFWAFVFGAIALTGWFPILMCAVDSTFFIGYGFVGTWAWWALIVYCAMSVGVIILITVKPDPDGLPPSWKFLAMFYKIREEQTINASGFDASRYASHTNPLTTYGKRMKATVAKHAAAKMKERARREEKETTEYIQAIKEQAEAADSLNKAKARVEALDKWRQEKSGRGKTETD